MARTITLRLRQPQNILGIESKAESHQSNSNSSNMKKQRLAHVIGTLVSSLVAYPDERAPKRILQDPSTASASASASAYKVDRMEKLERKEGHLASGIREHVKLGPKITETVKGKLSLGAKIIRAGGVEKIFKQNFSIREGEKLLKASQCYLSTTAGPVAGLLFISTDKVAFFSDRSIKLSSPIGEFIRIRCKVVIPLVKIKRANESQNMKRPSQKYIEIVTVDNFDFWFMGFLNYRGTFKYLQQALSQAQYLQLDQKRAVHGSVYDKNLDEQVRPTVVPDDVIKPQSDKCWAPHPQTGVFGPATEQNPAAGFHSTVNGGEDLVLEQKAFFRPLEDLDKPSQP
ncbi:hypothetical protein ACSBR2_039135 [Camellia fascicularis]